MVQTSIQNKKTIQISSRRQATIEYYYVIDIQAKDTSEFVQKFSQQNSSWSLEHVVQETHGTNTNDLLWVFPRIWNAFMGSQCI